MRLLADVDPSSTRRFHQRDAAFALFLQYIPYVTSVNKSYTQAPIVDISYWIPYHSLMIDENASEQVRVYPSDYKYLTEEAKKRRTIVAQIIHEALEVKDGVQHE